MTHRVVSVDDPGTGDGARELVLQGDANASVDRDTYVVTEAQRIVVGAPYVGYAVTILAQPKTLAAVTVLMSVLTVWIFWPASPGRAGAPGRPDAQGRRARRPARHLAA